MRFTDRSGVTICYETYGDPDDVPLMLVSGLGMQLVRWDDELLAALTARGFFVIAHDNRDIGLSESFAHVEVDVIAAVMAAMEGTAVEAPYLLSDMAADAVAVTGEASTTGLPDAACFSACMPVLPLSSAYLKRHNSSSLMP